MSTGKRLIAATALIGLLTMMAACNKQACYRDGQRERKPSMPFASVVHEAAPVAGLAASYTQTYLASTYSTLY